MNYDPTPSQALLLFGILARHGQCAQAELMPKVKKADRDSLQRAKLISVGKVGRGISLLLSDTGWAWTAAHLTAALPPAQRTLSDLLTRLAEHLARNAETLADFVGSKPEPHSPPKSKASPKMLSPAAVRKRIEAAYLALTHGRKDQTVRLSLLRSELSDLGTTGTAQGCR